MYRLFVLSERPERACVPSVFTFFGATTSRRPSYLIKTPTIIIITTRQKKKKTEPTTLLLLLPWPRCLLEEEEEEEEEGKAQEETLDRRRTPVVSPVKTPKPRRPTDHFMTPNS